MLPTPASCDFRVIIINDELTSDPKIRTHIKSLFPNINIGDSVVNLKRIIPSIKINCPEIIILDIDNIIRLNGLLMLKQIRELKTEIICLSKNINNVNVALNNDALFLLTPIKKEELVEIINIVLNRVRERRYIIYLEEINLYQNNIFDHSLIVQTKQERKIIDINSIKYIESNRRQTQTIIKNKSGKEFIVCNKNIDDYTELLKYNIFFRIHDKYLINLNYVDYIVKEGDGFLCYLLDGGKVIPLTIDKLNEIKKIITSISL